MSIVLKRPMFKLGGSSDGVGITSGFRTGYAHGQSPRWGPEEEIIKKTEDVELLQPEQDIGFFNEEYKKLYEKMKNPEKEKYGKPDLLWDMYRTSKGATDWKDWISGGADLALERRDAKKLEDKARPGKIMEAALAGGKGMTDYLKATTDPQTIARMNLMKNVMTTIEQWKADNPDAGIMEFLESGNIFEIDSSIRSANPAWPGVSKMRRDIENDLNDILQSQRENIDVKVWKEAEQEAYRKQQIEIFIGEYLGFSGNAMGGKPTDRRGYNLGMGPAMDQQTDMSMTENIQTPGGDMSMTENVDMTQMGQQAGMPSQTTPSDDPFVLLRARLPKEISDDVVRLIAYNPEAFADFADIETQDDVMAFNKKYGVELVVNTDEVSGAIA
jgi:hypothetical protein